MITRTLLYRHSRRYRTSTVQPRLVIVVLFLFSFLATTTCQEYDNFILEAYHHRQQYNNDEKSDGSIGGGFTWLADLPPPPTTTTTTTKVDGDDITNENQLDTVTKMIWDRTDDLLSRYWPRRRDGYSFHQKRQQQEDDGDGDDDANDRNDDDDDDDDNDHTFTYGEVTALGVRQLVYEMGLFTSSSTSTTTSSSSSSTTPSSSTVVDDDPSRIVFMDVGSGVGKLVVQIFLEYVEPTLRTVGAALTSVNQQQQQESTTNSPTTLLRTQVIGVELSKQRHEVAVEAWDGVAHEIQLTNLYSRSRGDSNEDGYNLCMESSDEYDACQQPHQRRVEEGDDDDDESSSNVQFIHANALDVDFSNVTHIFMSSLCFPEEVLKEIQLKLLKDAKKLQVVASLNRLDEFLRTTTRNDENYYKGWKERIVPIQMSWGPSTAKIYHRVSLDADDT